MNLHEFIDEDRNFNHIIILVNQPYIISKYFINSKFKLQKYQPVIAPSEKHVFYHRCAASQYNNIGDTMYNYCKLRAKATVRGGSSAPGIWGQVSFFQKENYVLVTAHITGLPETSSGFFGFHIHEGENCDGINFANTANHYNPSELPHPNHAGDLPPLIYCNGKACQSFSTDRFKVKDIIGRTVVIHNMPDDFNSQPSGNAGTKIACGVICVQ